MKVQLYYGHVASNWGDLAINAGVVDLLGSCGVNVAESQAVLLWPNDAFLRHSVKSLGELRTHLLPVGGEPRDGTSEIDLLVGYLDDPMRFVRDTNMDEYDAVVLNAGEHLFETASGGNTLDLIWRILPAVAAASIGVPVVLMPSTVGPFRTAVGTAVESFVDTNVVAAAYRDSVSQRFAANGAVGARRVLMDPGFFVFAARSAKKSSGQLENLGIVMRLEDSGIRQGSRRTAFVQQKFRETDFRDSQAFGLGASIAADHAASGGTVTIIVQTRSDRELSLALYSHLVMRFGEQRVRFKDPETFAAFTSELRRLDGLVTSRFHAVILASAQGVPSVGVYSETHGHKMPGLFEYLKFASGAVRLDSRNVSVVSREVSEALSVAVQETPILQNRIRANRSVTRRWLTGALAAIDSVTVPVDDSLDLRVRLLAALYRLGVLRREEEALAGMRRDIRALTTRLDQHLLTDSTDGRTPDD